MSNIERTLLLIQLIVTIIIVFLAIQIPEKKKHVSYDINVTQPELICTSLNKQDYLVTEYKVMKNLKGELDKVLDTERGMFFLMYSCSGVNDAR